MENAPEILHSKRILVVEDYLDSQEITCELLRLMGHTADGVASAEEALLYIEKNTIDILLTDINLPKMSGIELAKCAVERNPGTHIIFASGHAGFDPNSVAFSAKLLPKPFDFDTLMLALDAIS